MDITNMIVDSEGVGRRISELGSLAENPVGVPANIRALKNIPRQSSGRTLNKINEINAKMEEIFAKMNSITVHSAEALAVITNRIAVHDAVLARRAMTPEESFWEELR